MNLVSSRQIFAKCSNIKFHEYPSREAELFHADRHDEPKGTCRNFANMSKNHLHLKEIILFPVCFIDFRDILVTNGNRE